MTPAVPRHCGDHDADIARHAADFADRDRDEAEAMVAALTDQAIRRWRLDDATFWQRVGFRARLIRATRLGAGHAASERGTAC